jgi:hypothetical protein
MKLSIEGTRKWWVGRKPSRRGESWLERKVINFCKKKRHCEINLLNQKKTLAKITFITFDDNFDKNL